MVQEHSGDEDGVGSLPPPHTPLREGWGCWVWVFTLHIPAQPGTDGTRAPPGARGVARSFSPGSAPNPSHPWHRDPEDPASPCLASLLLLIREAGAARAAPTSRGRLMGNRFPQCWILGWGEGHTHPKPAPPQPSSPLNAAPKGAGPHPEQEVGSKDGSLHFPPWMGCSHLSESCL